MLSAVVVTVSPVCIFADGKLTVVLRTVGVMATLTAAEEPGCVTVNGALGPNCLLRGGKDCPGGMGNACHAGVVPAVTEAGVKAAAMFSAAVVTVLPVLSAGGGKLTVVLSATVVTVSPE